MKNPFLFLLTLTLGLSSVQAAVITQWNFNGASVGTTTPNSGTGTLALVGGTSNTFASGDASGGSSDPTVGSPPDFGFNVSTFPTTNAADETAGVGFSLNTVGFEDIIVSWDQRHSNTASRYVAFYYTLDGTTFTKLNLDNTNATVGVTPTGGAPASTAGLFGPSGTLSAFDGTVTGAGDDWFNGRSVNLSSITGADNNANFGFRFVSSFGGGLAYQASSSGTYGTTSTWRFDMVTINGTPIAVPEPSRAVLMLAGLAGFFFRRRRV